MQPLTVRPLGVALVLAAAIAAALVRPTPIAAQADARERTLFLSAVNDKGEPIDDLRATDVIVREDGARREILRVSRATEPIDIALLVDNSVAASGAVVPMRSALKKFVDAMAEGNQIAVITLADRPTVAVEYTNDVKRLENGVSIFANPSSGMTLLDALYESSEGLSKREAPRAVIVAVVNDGVEYTNRFNREVIERMKSVDAQFHAVTVGTMPPGSDTVTRERSFVLQLGTKETGGQRILLLSPMGLDNALGKLARELRSQYKVVYNRPESLIPPEKLEIDSARAGVTLRGSPMRGQTGA